MILQRHVFFWGVLSTAIAYGTGFEPALLMSGKNVGMGSAVTSVIQGPESMYFNPAGLVMASADESAPKNAISVSAGYLRSEFKAPLYEGGAQESSDIGHNFLGAAFYSRQLSEKLAFGVGIFPSAGLASEYGDKLYPQGAPITANPKANLKVMELSTGLAYQVTPAFSFGAAYRILYSSADFTAVDSSLGTPIAGEFTGLKGWDFFSFRTGAQYKTEHWGAGINIRTPVVVKLKGDFKVSTGFGPPTTDDDASISTTFPLLLTLGGHWNATTRLRLQLDYNFFNYKATDDIAVTTSIPGIPNTPLKWHNAHIFRAGVDYDFGNFNARGGLVYTTQVVDEETATPNHESPGDGYLVAFGGGWDISETMQLNLSAFYGWAKATVRSAGAPDGDYEVAALGIYTGFDWKF